MSSQLLLLVRYVEEHWQVSFCSDIYCVRPLFPLVRSNRNVGPVRAPGW